MASGADGIMVEAGRLRIEIHGAVQGVGFRPFVYRLATELGLSGWVINDSRGVFIEVEGEQADLQAFLDRVSAEKPAISIVNSLDFAWLEPVGFSQFEIRHSDNQGGKSVLILPDIATCPDCLAEVLDPTDRRYHYPFTNCTNCGPRFSIIQALPYDRPNTTMHRFVMCPACQAEYDSPLDRRFHAQPNACPACGPQLALYERNTQYPASSDQFTKTVTGLDALLRTAAALRSGRIVAVKGLGGFHLMCDARNVDAIQLLRDRKPRPTKPLALMSRDLAQARTLVEIAAEAEKALTSPESPIVLLRRRVDAPVADNIAPGNPTLGVMLPYTPLHHLLLREVDFPIVATSGNLTDEPISIKGEEAIERLGHIADLFLLHDRPIERHVDDSIAWMLDDEVRLLRRARGFAPLPVSLPDSIATILAVGAHLKNTVAVSIGDQAFISQHIGDLETAEAMHAFERVIDDFLRLYEASPVAIAHDLHPEYLSTKWAKAKVGDQRPVLSEAEGSEVGRPQLPSLFPVQHHHAHLASVLAENHITGPALGVIWDGTGYGSDGTIWGGEFLLGDAGGYRRVAHLRPFRLPGGDSAVKEPRRVALALLWELFGEAVLGRDDLAPIADLSLSERKLLGQMLSKDINSPVTTSMGRLFDGVAALLDLHQAVSFEAEAAIALEYVADTHVQDSYPIDFEERGAGGREQGRRKATPLSTSDLRPPSSVLDWHPLITAILADLDRQTPIPTIAARFHNALVDAILAVAQHVGEPRVALSGGVFQNRLLVERTSQRLRENGFEVILHRQVPPNDGGISLGQIAIAARQFVQRTS